ncbi:MAG: glutamine--fructose-6-phosphate transaminase (isomerizing) [Candidatus Melainabacteria bacterium]|nr:glutamine--fructose-6-phosphate transaminase (isomerizing) [Candidatus Melainabacteria bacterium]
MCGIVGYVGNKDVIPILLEGLHSLEYRGYDSSGIAIHEGKNLSVIKSAGKISKLEELLLKSRNGNGKYCGIGHTRWATHGEPTDNNAHPHFDSDEKIAVVHNGIIRNYLEVKDSLIKKGIKFASDTDTEVIVQLVSSCFKETGSILSAIRQAVVMLEGSYALGIIFKDEPGKIYGVRKESPLVIGVGETENYLASDSPALSQFVDRIIRLGDGEIVELSKEKIELYNFDGKKINKQAQPVEKSKDIMDKKGYKHYLAKEISEQAEVVLHLLNDYLPSPKKSVKLDCLNFSKDFLDNIDRILILACGTAYHAGLVGKHVIENITAKPVEVQLASEFLNTKALLTKKSLVIGISQSGETADTIAAVKKALDTGATLLGITNRPDSALADLAKDHLIISHAGLEVSVCATKTFIAQMTVLYLFALYVAESLGKEDKKIFLLKQELRMVPQLIDQTITRGERYQEQVLKYADKPDFVFIGRGINYPIALEAALKLKELSYIHASGYAAGEMKHGPIAVLDPDVPVVSIVVPGDAYDRVFQNSIEAKARQAPMIAVAVDGDKKVESVFNTVLHIPPIIEILSPFLTVIPMQFLAYYIAEHLGCDIDQPRNLAKSVTVE